MKPKNVNCTDKTNLECESRLDYGMGDFSFFNGESCLQYHWTIYDPI